MAILPFKSSHQPLAFDLEGRRALVITTSQRTLDTLDPDTGAVLKRGKPTGVYAAEMTEPYYVFQDSGLQVDLASIQGGAIPIEAQSLWLPVRTRYDSRFLKDEVARRKAEHSLSIADVDVRDYDILFMAGGWGAAYDLMQSPALNERISQAYAAGKVLGSVCHGALGFIGAVKPDGSPLVEGVRLTGVTNRQLKALGVTHTPKHPETELRNAGACYEWSHHRITDLFANHITVDGDHGIVSAQNQKGGAEAAERALAMLAQRTNG